MLRHRYKTVGVVSPAWLKLFFDCVWNTSVTERQETKNKFYDRENEEYGMEQELISISRC
jgi:hypothetical protein